MLYAEARYIVRGLFRDSVFTCTIIATMALGLGSVGTLSALVNGVIVRPLDYKESNRLVVTTGVVLAGDYRDIQSQNNVFERMALFEPRSYLLRISEQGQAVQCIEVSSDFLPMLGVAPILGRNFEPSDYHPGTNNVALLSYAFWRQRFNSDMQIIGAPITLNTKIYTVIGVLPHAFSFKSRWFEDESAIWLPLALSPPQLEKRGTSSFTGRGPEPGSYSTAILARTRPGVTIAQAQRNLASIIDRLISRYPGDRVLRGRQLEPLKHLQIGPIGKTLWPLFGGALLLLAIACINVAGLIAARGLKRHRETLIRIALGAGRIQILKISLLENLFLFLVAAALALLISDWSIHVIQALCPQGYVPRLREASVNTGVVGLTFLLAMLAALICGLSPMASLLRAEPLAHMTSGSPSISSRPGAPQRLLLIAQISAATVLLVSAALVGRSLWLTLTESSGFDSQDVIEVALSRADTFHTAQTGDLARNRVLSMQLLDRIKAIPAVQSASMANLNIGYGSLIFFGEPDDVEEHPEDASRAYWWNVTPDFFATLRIPLLRGRYFTLQDAPGSQPAIIIDRTLAQLYFGGRDPIGRSLTYLFMDQPTRARIVGEVNDTRMAGLRSPRLPEIYTCLWQTTGIGELFLRTAVTAASVEPAIRDSFRKTSKDLVIVETKSAGQALSDSSVARPKFIALLIGISASLALILTVVGIFAAASLSVARRTREIGIRITLGAQKRDVLRAVLRDSIVMTLEGVAIGTLAALGLTRLIASWLYGIAPDDAVTFIASAALFIATCLMAGYIPSRRALSVDPMVALRYE